MKIQKNLSSGLLKRNNKSKQTNTSHLLDRQQDSDARGNGSGSGRERVNGRINGDGRRLDLGWGTHNTMYRGCIIELYT